MPFSLISVYVDQKIYNFKIDAFSISSICHHFHGQNIFNLIIVRSLKHLKVPELSTFLSFQSQFKMISFYFVGRCDAISTYNSTDKRNLWLKKRIFQMIYHKYSRWKSCSTLFYVMWCRYCFIWVLLQLFVSHSPKRKPNIFLSVREGKCMCVCAR